MLIEIKSPYLFLNSVVALNRIILVSSYTIKEGIVFYLSFDNLFSFLILIENISTIEFELGIKAQVASSLPLPPPEKKNSSYTSYLFHSNRKDNADNIINIEINSQTASSHQNSIVRFVFISIFFRKEWKRFCFHYFFVLILF